MKIEFAEMSVLGDREDNQDRSAVVVSDHAALLLVFDGMGGHSDGAAAAELGLKTVKDAFLEADKPVFDPQGFLYMALSRAHDMVVNLGADLKVDFRPRATCAICLVQEDGSYWAHVGDSRIYHMRDGWLVSRSRDHSYVEVLIQEGQITEEEALEHPMRNFVESCIGGDSAVPAMSITRKNPLEDGDVLLACSDGLWSGLSDEEISRIATRRGRAMQDILNALSGKALKRNSPYSDNTTGAVLRWRQP